MIAVRQVVAAATLAALAACQPVPPQQQAARRACVHQTGSRLCVDDDSADDLTRQDPGIAIRDGRGGPAGH